MLLQIHNVLAPGELEFLRKKTAEAAFVDGALTAGSRAKKVKHNQQIAADSPAAGEIGKLVFAALARNGVFQSAALPRRISPPLVNRHGEGMDYGNHLDNALMGQPNVMRADVSATLFLSEPASYEGGELVIEDDYGFHNVKLAAGNMILYPSTSIHRVDPVRSGIRDAVVIWVQSAVREAERRRLLFNLDMSIQRLNPSIPDNPEVGKLTACYGNLLRMWADV